MLRAMGSSFGVLFRITTFGESHGPGARRGVDGCPPRLPLDLAQIQAELDRRRPGQSRLVSQRKEADQVEILSGVLDGVTLGTPIAMLIRNQDARSKDYEEIARAYRPSHADYTYDAKYGIRAVAGGGRASARETVGAGRRRRDRAAAARAARRLDRRVGRRGRRDRRDRRRRDGHARRRRRQRRPLPRRGGRARAMIERIERARKDGDSVGGVVRAVARGVPAGLGRAGVRQARGRSRQGDDVSIPAVKGVEIGSGFAGTLLTGSEHNDLFYRRDDGAIGTRTNRSGGIQGGISNGEPITLRVAFKPTATIMRPQETVDRDGNPTVLEPKGRHDPCVLPRAVPIVEAMIALVLADHCLRQQAR